STANPFYAISAALFLGGLRTSFAVDDGTLETWTLMAGLFGYTLLLAVTGWGLVRYGRVWDDARTVLLLVVLMLLATSVTFDRALVSDRPDEGRALFLLGFGFAVSVSEGVVRSLRLKFPAGFRVPYFLALGLFFGYPLLLAPLAATPYAERTLWALFAFPAAAGVIALSLLPAARAGARIVAENGSPWPWPWYPWSLFGLLAAAVPARAFLLCKSFHLLQYSDFDGMIFGPYFLAPFALAVAAVVLEAGRTARNFGTMQAALAVPLLTVVLCGIGHRAADGVYWLMLGQFESAFGGGPVFVALVAAAGFYAVAVVRRVEHAADWLTAALVGLAVMSPTARKLTDFGAMTPWPFLAASAVLVGHGLWRRDALRCAVGAAAVVAVAVAVPWATPAIRAVVGFHLVVAVMLTIGAMFRNTFGGWLRATGVGALLVGSVVSMLGSNQIPTGVPETLAVGYPFAAALVVGLYAVILRDEVIAVVAAAILGCWLFAAGVWGYTWLRQHVVGLDAITLSVLAFGIAVVMSSVKASRNRRAEQVR
ncbi:MAG: hypothetical protein ACRC7O_02660, partial [Fimbriiglobus sp.]